MMCLSTAFSMGCDNGECFIDPVNGQDVLADSCSVNTPCLSIEFAAEQVAVDNDTITLLPGIYIQTRQTDVRDGMTIRGATSDVSLYSIQLLNTFSNRAFNLLGAGALFENFEVVGVTSAGDGPVFRCNSGPAAFRNLLLRDAIGTRSSDELFFFNADAEFTMENIVIRNITLPRGGTSLVNYQSLSRGTVSNLQVSGCSCGRMVFYENEGMNRVLTNSAFINNVGTDVTIRALNGDLTISNTDFIGNTGNNAGAIRLDSNLMGNPNITNCTFIENFSFGDAGALSTFVRNGVTLTIQDCLFDSNTLATVNEGGAIFSSGDNTVIDNTIFRNHSLPTENIAGVQLNGRGGTISNNRGLTITNSIFENGSVGQDGFGAAIYSTSTLVLQNVSFDSFFGRGTLGYEGGTHTLESVTFTNNQGTPDIAIDAGVINWMNSPPTFLSSVILSVGSQFNPTSDLDIGNLAIFEAAMLVDGGANIQVLDSFLWTGGTIGNPGGICNLTIASTATGTIDTENHNLRCPLYNFGDLEIFSSISGNTITMTSDVPLFNGGTMSIIGSSLNEATITGGNSDIINNGTLRVFQAFFNRPLICGETSQLVTQLRNINETNGLRMGSDPVTADGILVVERDFPFWATPGEFYDIITTISTLTGSFTGVTGLGANIVTDSSTVSLEITDTPFVIGDDFIETDEDAPTEFIPFFNDFAAGGILSFIGTSDDTQFSYDEMTSVLTYTPSANLDVSRNYTYMAQDQFGTILQGTIIVNITPINDPPDELEPALDINIDESVTNITLAGQDIDSPNLQYVFTQLPQNGRIQFRNGTALNRQDLPVAVFESNLTYVVPNADSSSLETFTYNLFDGQFSSASSEININYQPPSEVQTTEIIVAVIFSVLGACVCFAFIIIILTCVILKPRKPRAKTALEHFIARSDLALVLSLIELNETDSLAEYITTFFLYHRANSTLLAYLIGDTVSQEEQVVMLFRENSFASKLLKNYMQTTGAPLLKKLHPIIDEIIRDKHTSYEVDPNKLTEKSDPQANRENLKAICSKVFHIIRKSVDELPQEIREICEYLYRSVEEKWEDRGFQAIGAALFLRWLCPALVTPERCGLTRHVVNGETRRKLILISKVLQVLANGSRFGQKEGFLEFMNQWIDEIRPTYITFITTVLYTKTEKFHKVKEVAYKKAFLELHKLIINQSTELAESERMRGENIQELNKILIILGPPEDDLADEELRELEGKTSASSLIMKSNTSDEDYNRQSARKLSVDKLLKGPPPEKTSRETLEDDENHTVYDDHENHYDYGQSNSEEQQPSDIEIQND